MEWLEELKQTYPYYEKGRESSKKVNWIGLFLIWKKKYRINTSEVKVCGKIEKTSRRKMMDYTPYLTTAKSLKNVEELMRDVEDSSLPEEKKEEFYRFVAEELGKIREKFNL